LGVAVEGRPWGKTVMQIKIGHSREDKRRKVGHKISFKRVPKPRKVCPLKKGWVKKGRR